MQPLEPPDTHYLDAAIGWMELGVPLEAEAELCRITVRQQVHPDVLEVRWVILAETGRWDTALEIARALMKQAPNRCTGWLHQAHCLRRVSKGGLQQAWEALLPAYAKFPREATIPYNLSCYACQMEQFEQARTWLRRALKVGGKDKIKRKALDDPDLQALWDEIKKL